KWPDFLTIDDDGADQLTILAHWHCHKRPRAAKSGWSTGICSFVGAINCASCLQQTVEWRSGRRFKCTALSMKFAKCLRRVQCGRRAEHTVFVAEQHTELGIANACRIGKDRLKDGLKIARRT